MLQTLLGRKQYEEAMSDEHPLMHEVNMLPPLSLARFFLAQ